MRVTVLHNPSAGGEELDRERLLELVEKAGYRADYHSTKHNGWKKALDDPRDLVIVAGGDGTVAKVARRLAGRGVPLAIIPLGTANNIAASLGIGGSPESIISGWETTQAVPTDLALATGPWGEKFIVEAVGLGVLPRLFHESRSRVPKSTTPVAEQIPRNVELLLEILHRTKSLRLGIELDGRDLSGEYLMVEAMNIRAIGPRLDLAPDADPGDGMLDVVLVREGDRAVLAQFLRRRLGDGEDDTQLTCVRGKHLRIRSEVGVVHLDDRTWRDPDKGPAMTIDVQMLGGALSVLR